MRLLWKYPHLFLRRFEPYQVLRVRARSSPNLSRIPSDPPKMDLLCNLSEALYHIRRGLSTRLFALCLYFSSVSPQEQNRQLMHPSPVGSLWQKRLLQRRTVRCLICILPRFPIFCAKFQKISAISWVSTNSADKICYSVPGDRGARQTATAVQSSSDKPPIPAVRAAAIARGSQSAQAAIR